MRWIGVAAVLTIAACASVNGVGQVDDHGGVEYEFTVGPVQPGTGATPRHAALGEAGGFAITGSISTPVPCYRVTGDIVRDGREIRLRIVATPEDVICIQVIANWGYEASVRDLDPGRYRVTVVHSGATGAAAEQVVLTSEVDVR
jgi:hypothetical protein